VWPSWWKACAKLGPPNDKAQVRTVARIFSAADRAGELGGWFTPAISQMEARQAVAEEAWTLGVTTPRTHAKRSPSPRKRGLRATAQTSTLAPRSREGDSDLGQSAR
jgi:hypothetical protein